MKRIKIISSSVLLGLLMLSANVNSQGGDKPAPSASVKILLDNERTKVIEAELAPGAVADWHSHPNHVVYALTDGKLEVTPKGKPAKIVDLKAGTAMYSPAVTHMVKNIGTTTVKMVITELKPEAVEKNNK